MLNVNPLSWFEIPATDLNRARAFYEVVLETLLQPFAVGPVEMMGFPGAVESYGAQGALAKSPEHKPGADGITVYLSVDSIPPVQARIDAAGGKLLTPIIDIGQNGSYLYFLDSEGNKVGLHQSAAN